MVGKPRFGLMLTKLEIEWIRRVIKIMKHSKYYKSKENPDTYFIIAIGKKIDKTLEGIQNGDQRIFKES